MNIKHYFLFLDKSVQNIYPKLFGVVPGLSTALITLTLLVFIVSLVRVIFSILRKVRKQSQLKELGFWRKKIINTPQSGVIEKSLPPKVICKRNKIIIKKYNSKLNEHYCNSKNFLSSLSNIFGKDIVNCTAKKSFFGPSLIFHYNQMPSMYSYHDIKNKEEKSIEIGKDIFGQSIFLNIEQLPFILVTGRQGSGKSELAKVITYSILKKIKHNLLVIDGKGTDFIKLSERFNGIVHDPKDCKELKILNKKLREILSEYDLFLNKLKAEGTQVRHWNKLRETRTDVPDRYFILVDEFAQFWDKGSFPKLNKDSPSDLREYSEERLNLLRSINRLLQLYRISGTKILLMSQGSNLSDYHSEVNFTNFSVKFFSKLNHNQSLQNLGDDYGVDDSLINGKFIFQSPEITTKVQVPLIINEETL